MLPVKSAKPPPEELFTSMRSKLTYRPKIDDPKTCLDLQGLKYVEAAKSINKMNQKSDEILDIKEYLIKFRVPCYKYNYSLDPETQSDVSFLSFMELSKDSKYIKITNRKPVNHTKYILEADKELISNELEK